MKRISIEEYKKITVDILYLIDKICREYNLKYYLFYGTLLGAVRHQGFIPWDDDIDIAMPRKDYVRLSQIINDNNYGINFISIETNKDTIFPHGKVCDTRTVLYEKNFRNVDGYGAFVDVFPLDYAPNNEKERLKQRNYLRRLIILATHSARTGFSKSNSLRTNCSRLAAYLVGRMFNTRKLLEYINAYMVKRDNEATDYYRVFGGGIFEVRWIDGDNTVHFEGHILSAPLDVDSVLNTSFGDYMRLPPKEEQVNKHQLECYYKGEI